MPLPLWGWLLITSGLLTIIGFVGRWRHVTIGGLHISGALMAVLGAGIAAQSLNAADGGGDGPRCTWWSRSRPGVRRSATGPRSRTTGRAWTRPARRSVSRHCCGC